MVRCTRERPPRTSLHLSLYLNNYAIVLRLSPRKNPTPHRIQPRFSSTLREYPTERRFEVQLGRRAFFRCSLARDQRQTTAAFIDWCCWLAAPAPDSTAAATTTTRRLLLLERLAAESDLVVVSGCFFWFRKVGISIGRQGRLRRCDAWLLVHGFLAELELRMMQSASQSVLEKNLSLALGVAFMWLHRLHGVQLVLLHLFFHLRCYSGQRRWTVPK